MPLQRRQPPPSHMDMHRMLARRGYSPPLHIALAAALPQPSSHDALVLTQPTEGSLSCLSQPASGVLSHVSWSGPTLPKASAPADVFHDPAVEALSPAALLSSARVAMPKALMPKALKPSSNVSCKQDCVHKLQAALSDKMNWLRTREVVSMLWHSDLTTLNYASSMYSACQTIKNLWQKLPSLGFARTPVLPSLNLMTVLLFLSVT